MIWYDIYDTILWYIVWYMTWYGIYDMIYDIIYMITYDMIHDMIWYMTWYDIYMIYMIWYVIWYMIYLLTSIGLPPGDSSTVHIYTQTIHSAGRYVDCSPHTSLRWKQRTHKCTICCQIAHNNEIFIILIVDFSKEQYVLPEDDMRYAIETCRSILSVLV